MKSLTQLYTESKSSILALMSKYYDEVMNKYLNKYMVDQKIFINSPSFGVKSHPRWHAWYNPTESAIYISTTTAEHADAQFIKSLMYHEAIHYVQTCLNADRSNPHGSFFIKCMNDINRGEGYELVKIKDEEVIYDSDKPFRVIGFKDNNGYYFAKITKESTLESSIEICKKIAKRYNSTDVFTFMCTLGYFKRQLPSMSVGKGGKLVQFKESDANKDVLAKLYKLADSSIVKYELK